MILPDFFRVIPVGGVAPHYTPHPPHTHTARYVPEQDLGEDLGENLGENLGEDMYLDASSAVADSLIAKLFWSFFNLSTNIFQMGIFWITFLI